MRASKNHFVHLNARRVAVKPTGKDPAQPKRKPKPPQATPESNAKATYLMAAASRRLLTRSFTLSPADMRAAVAANLQRGATSARWLANPSTAASEAWKASDPHATIKLRPATATAQFCAAMQQRYPKAVIDRSTEPVTIDVSRLSLKESHAAHLDARLAQNFPALPVENLFASFATFHGSELSQRVAAARVAQFCSSPDTERAVLVLEGAPGAGKSHLAASAAKASFAAGRKVLWITPETAAAGLKIPWIPYDIIIDDFNSGYGQLGEAYRTALAHVREHGGRLLITTNHNAEKLLDEACVLARKADYQPFIATNQLVVRVDAPSKRTEQSWWLAPTKEVVKPEVAPTPPPREEIPLTGAMNAPEFTRALQRNFPRAQLVQLRRGAFIETGGMANDELSRLLADLDFFRLHPSIPAEDIFARLDNFVPGNEGQQKVLDTCNQLLGYDGPFGGGLLHQGDPGTGKTHLAVAMAKEFAARGYTTFFINPANAAAHPHTAFPANSVIIIDDANTGYGQIAEALREAILAVHNKGARLFVTTNHKTDKLLEEATALQRTERPRYMDRVRGSLLQVSTAGESERARRAWYASAPAPGRIPDPPYASRNDNTLRVFYPGRVTAGFLAGLTATYPDAVLDPRSDGTMVLDTSGLDYDALRRLVSDLRFIDRYRQIGDENAFARLDNYEPQNDSQRQMLSDALRLLEYNGAQASGLVLQGKPGVGKSHIAVGLAKALFDAGKRVMFLDAVKLDKVPSTDIAPGTVIVLDNIENGYGAAGTYLAKLAIDLRERGGQLVITTTVPIDEVLRQVSPGSGSNESQGLVDRLKASLLTIEVDGESERVKRNWLSSAPSAASLVSEPLGEAANARFLDVELDLVPEPYLRSLLRTAPGAQFSIASSLLEATIDLRKCTPADRQRIVDDIAIYQSTRDWPSKAAGLRLGALRGRDRASENAIVTAQRLVASSAPAGGLLIRGDSRSDREVLGLATVKELAAQGRHVMFLSETTDPKHVAAAAPGTVFYAPGIDNAYGHKEVLREALDRVHQRGGRLVVASKLDVETFASQVTIRVSTGREPVKDRVAALLPAVDVTSVTLG